MVDIKKLNIKQLTAGIIAQSSGTNPPSQGKNPPSSGGVSINNPLKYGTLPEILNAVAVFLYRISLPIITIMVLVAAYQMLTAAGDPAKFAKGKKTFIYAIIGTVVILVAGGISQLVGNILSGSSGGGGGSGGGGAGGKLRM